MLQYGGQQSVGFEFGLWSKYEKMVRDLAAFQWVEWCPFFVMDSMKLFYTGPGVNAELLIHMLEKHDIAASQDWAEPKEDEDEDDDDLNRLAKVFVSPSDYPRAYDLFYAEREDEL